MSDLEVLAGVLDELIKAGINLSALQGDDASKLGTVFGRQLRAAEQRGYERAHEEQALAATYQGDPEKYPEAYRAWQSTVDRSLAADLAASRQAGQREGFERAIEVLRAASDDKRYDAAWRYARGDAADYLTAVASSLVKGDSGQSTANDGQIGHEGDNKPAPTGVPDLMANLRASLDRAKAERATQAHEGDGDGA